MKHLRETKSTYLKHFVYASYFNILAIGIVITGIIHSVFPFLFEFTPYNLAKKIIDDTDRHFKNIK